MGEETSVFIKILRFLLCCEEEHRYDKTSNWSPLIESETDDTHVRRRSSAPTNNDLFRESDPTRLYYYEYYPNISVTDSTSKDQITSSLRPKAPVDRKEQISSSHARKSLEKSEVSKNLMSSSNLQSTFSNKPATSLSKPLQSSPITPSFSNKPATSFSKYLERTSEASQNSKSLNTTGKQPTASILHPQAPVDGRLNTSAPVAPACDKKSLKKTSEVSQNSKILNITGKQPTASILLPQAPVDKRLNTSAPAAPACDKKSLERISEVSQNSKNLNITGKQPTASILHPQAPVDNRLNTSAPAASACDKKSLERISEVSQNSKSSCHGQTAFYKPASGKLQTEYVWVRKDKSPIYKIPNSIEVLIKEDIAPEVLKKPLSRSTYKDHFAALLYAEDFYIEKWNDYTLKNVTLELEEALIYARGHKEKSHREKEKKIFVKFEVDSIPERRPFLLSRDFVFARPLGRKVEPFQGIIYRVVRGNAVLVEFGEDFHSQHNSTRKYDVSFSFNRVCLKRAHEAVASASDSLFDNFIFPSDFVSRKCFPISPSPLLHCEYSLDSAQRSAVSMILSLEAAPPYLVEGNGVNFDRFINHRSSVAPQKLRSVVLEAVLQIYESRNPVCRILICAPSNTKCDELLQSLKNKVPESHMFRANAAFRELDEVPEDILPSCRYTQDRDCFVCPPLLELQKFQVIFSTFMSSVRLHDKGIATGHFSHIFLVEASSVTEPEALVPLASLANDETVVVVTGMPGDHSSWVRSDIARRHGLKISYFERLCNSKQYSDFDPEFITRF